MKDDIYCFSSLAFANVPSACSFLQPLCLHTCHSLGGGAQLPLALDCLENTHLSFKTQLNCHFYYETFYDCPLKNGSRLCSTNVEPS